MRKPATYFVLLALCAALAGGCTGTGFLNSLYKTPTPTPSPVINPVPTSLSFTASSKGPTTLTISENTGNTFFTATTTDATIATVAPQGTSTNVFDVTATGKVGSCNIQISDGSGGTINVPVSTT